MNGWIALAVLVALAGSTLAVGETDGDGHGARWPAGQANAWYAQQPWLVGCNFIPSNAVNQLEMWQADTFDLDTIERELGWAAKIGFNAMRVYLHDLAWKTDAEGFKSRIDRYLDVAARHKIRTAFVLFDDCWNSDPKPGKQPDPIPGVHNSGWLQSPGPKVVNDPASWPRLERYAKGLLDAFGHDPRIVFWDLYNEPGNSDQGAKSLPFLQNVFRWAREAKPAQPLTVGIWRKDTAINGFLLENVDLVTFHNYGDAPGLKRQIKDLKAHGRPVVCTEWLRRTAASEFRTHLPLFHREHVGCFNWGLVAGKTQTIYPWGSKEGSPEPETWFHDLLRKDGRPFDPAETELIGRLVRQSGPE